MNETWNALKLYRTSDWALMGGRAGVGIADAAPVERIWSDEQLGIEKGNMPTIPTIKAPVINTQIAQSAQSEAFAMAK